jgi:hypothetical protein
MSTALYELSGEHKESELQNRDERVYERCAGTWKSIRNMSRDMKNDQNHDVIVIFFCCLYE